MRGDKPLAVDLLDRDLQYDVDINGLRFLSGTSVQSPYQRALAKVLRAQMDNNDNPDSNSLAGWWIRGQGDWSGGSGRIYQEPPSNDFAQRQFDSSSGVDPFSKPGFLTLLPKPVKVGEFAAAGGVVEMVDAGTSRFVGSGTSVHRITDTGLVEITGLKGTVSSMLLAGGTLVAFTDQGGFSCAIDGVAFTEVYTTTKGAIRGTWVKQRMILSQGPRLYEQTLPVTVVDFDSLKPLYTHPDGGYEWVAATNAPTAILVAGGGSGGSEVFALTFDATGKLPTAAAPVSVAEFPPNERLTDMRSYLGSFVAFASDKGVRIGGLNDTGGFVTYGPLLNAPVPTGKFSVYDRFFIYPTSDAGDLRGGLVKIDVSVVDDDGRAAWASFLRAGSARCGASVILTGREGFVSDTDGASVSVWSFKEVNGLEAGWIQGSWVRYGTLECKNFIDLTVVTEPMPEGSVTVTFCDDREVKHLLGTLVGQETTFPIGLDFVMPDGACRLDIAPAVNGRGPVVNSWSLRALPTPKSRSQMVQLVLNCYDFEKDMHGVSIGYSGRANARWLALVSLLQDGGTVTVNELSANYLYRGMCEELSFTQLSAPAPDSGFGGQVLLTLRVVG